MTELLLGIDIGTTNIKAVLAAPDGRVVAQAQSDYSLQKLKPGWVEQNPEDWWKGAIAVTREAMRIASANPEQVAGIGASGQGCAVTLIDDSGSVVRPAIIWMDSRSEPQSEQLRRCCNQDILRANGKSPAPYNSDPVLMWLQLHEPESIVAARCSLTTTGYIAFRLTGEPVENFSDASILFAFDLTTRTWSDELIEAFGLPRKLYPHVAPCAQVIGILTRSAADDLGLRPGIPVVAGGEDTSAAGLAIGVVEPGQALLSLGTAGTLYVVQHDLAVHPQLLTFLHVIPDQSLLGGSMGAAGAALNWCSQLFAAHVDYAALLELAAQSQAGAGGVIFLPYLSGELQPINDGNARGVFFGLNLNTETPQLLRAVLESTAFAIAHNLSIADQVGMPIDEIRAVGGPARSALWCQIIADVTGRRLAVLPDNAGAPLGDALLAAAGVGLIDDPAAVASRSARIGCYYEPNESNHAYYRELFQIYQQLYVNLKHQFAALAMINHPAS
jgi:xylulokinase